MSDDKFEYIFPNGSAITITNITNALNDENLKEPLEKIIYYALESEGRSFINNISNCNNVSDDTEWTTEPETIKQTHNSVTQIFHHRCPKCKCIAKLKFITI